MPPFRPWLRGALATAVAGWLGLAPALAQAGRDWAEFDPEAERLKAMLESAGLTISRIFPAAELGEALPSFRWVWANEKIRGSGGNLRFDGKMTEQLAH